MTLLFNSWYVAGWSHEVGAENFLSRKILDIPMLFLRDKDGALRAVADRCPHRGAPLSLGCREGDAIRCGYHGIKFALSGRCLEIPGQTQIPDQARLPTYRVVERDNWIWVWPGDPDIADEGEIISIPWLNDPEWEYRPGYLHYEVDYMSIADNLLDFSHLPFVHASTLGGGNAFAATKPVYETLPNGLRISRFVEEAPAPPYIKKVSDWTGNVDRWTVYDFLVPGILLLDAGSMKPGTGAMEGDRVGAIQIRSPQAITPETTETTHYFFAQCNNFAVGRPEITEALNDVLVAAFEEDRRIIEAQKANLADAGEFTMFAIAADRGVLQFRRLMNSLIKKENAHSLKDKVPACEDSSVRHEFES